MSIILDLINDSIAQLLVILSKNYFFEAFEFHRTQWLEYAWHSLIKDPSICFPELKFKKKKIIPIILLKKTNQKKKSKKRKVSKASQIDCCA